MASGQKKDNQTDFSTIATFEECDAAKVTGVVANVSDMSPSKKGADYFHATLHDGEQQTRIFGFRKRQRDLLKEFEQTGEAVDISSCKIKKSKYGEELNVQLANNTVVTTSPRKISIDRTKLGIKSNIQLKDLSDLSDGLRVSCTVKVLRLEQKSVVSGGQSLQNVIIADSSLSSKIVLWNNDIGRLEIGNSYVLKNVVVKSYQNDKSLHFPKQGATIEEINDIGTVAPDDTPTYDNVTSSEVAGILSFDDYLMCIICKSKVQLKDDKSGICTNCNLIQKVNLCKKQIRAKLLLTRPGGNYITLNVFGEHLTEICEKNAITQDNLLAARPFNFTYKDQIMNTVSR